MTTSWDEIRRKIKQAHDEIDAAYQKHVVSAIDKVKERPLLNTAIKMVLPAIPVIGPTLKELYDNIGAGNRAAEEDKAQQILEFLSKLEQQSKEQFDRIAQDLGTNRHTIIDAVNENTITITDLISKSSGQILEEIHSVKDDTRVIRGILEKERPAVYEFKRHPKPSTFHEESNIFVGRQHDISKIKQYLAESNTPLSIVGEGGIGKSALGFKAIHECQDMFGVIIPVYFESLPTFNSFLLEMAKSLQLAMKMEQFERLENIQDKSDLIKEALGRYRRVLIYADNYETVRNSIINEGSLTRQSSKREDAILINKFLNRRPRNTYIILTSTERQNLTAEKVLHLQGLSIEESKKLFIKIAGDKLPENILVEMKTEVEKAIEEISKNVGGHPLSIEILASTYREILPELREMLEHLGAGVVNVELEKGSRHRSLEACFEYSISKLPEGHRSLLPKLAVMFKSPFLLSAVEFIFGDGGEYAVGTTAAIICDLYNSTLLRRIEFGEYGNVEQKYYLYYFHPSVRNYLVNKVHQEEKDKRQELEAKYGERFSRYYCTFLEGTYNAISTKPLGTRPHILSLKHLNAIISWGEDNDIERALSSAKDRSVAAAILAYWGLVSEILGAYGTALDSHNKALAIHKELQDKAGMAEDYRNIGIVHRRVDNYDQALQYLEQALAIHKELQDKAGMAEDYRIIGFFLQGSGIYDQGSGIYDQALQYLEQALAIHKELQDKAGMAEDYRNMGIVLEHRGTDDQLLSCYHKSLAIHKELQDKAGMAEDYWNIGLLLTVMKNREVEAIESFATGLQVVQELEDKSGYRSHLRDRFQSFLSLYQGERESDK